MPVFSPFTAEEDVALREWFESGEALHVIKERLHRHGYTIRRRLEQLGLNYTAARPRPPLWTPDEDDLLWRCERLADAAAILGRSLTACQSRIAALKRGSARSQISEEPPKIRRERAHLAGGNYRLNVPDIGRITAHYEGPYTGAGKHRHHLFRALHGGWLVCLSDADCLDPETRLKRCA